MNSFSQHLRSEYEALLSGIRSNFCTSKDIKEYYRLNSSLSRDVVYIPMLGDKLDSDTIKVHLPLIKAKIKWINSLGGRLSIAKGKIDITDKVKELEKSIDENLKAKRLFEVENRKTRKVINQAKASMVKIKKSFEDILSRVFYLKNFHFPINHTYNRALFERFKKEGKLKDANMIFFKRKIYEEGAPFRKHSSDRHVRMVLDNLSIRMSSFKFFLSERDRIDLMWLARMFNADKRLIDVSSYQSYFKAWSKSLKNKVKKYEELLNVSGATKEYITKKFKERGFADFVYRKHSDVYSYLSKQKKQLRKLYVVDSILYNEVGSVDPNNMFKEDILNVIFSRVNSPKFNVLGEDAMIRPFFKKNDKTNYPWLNILFNKGEFSFTYHYFSASRYIFCPPNTSIGKRLRKKNLDLFEEFEKKYSKTKNPKIHYYFSRVSMPGRIDMTEVWTHADPVVRKLGQVLSTEKLKEVKNYMINDQAKYLYTFQQKGKSYFAIKHDKDIYALDNLSSPSVGYRIKNEELFRFFKLSN